MPTATQWDQVGAKWDAAGLKWDVTIPTLPLLDGALLGVGLIQGALSTGVLAIGSVTGVALIAASLTIGVYLAGSLAATAVLGSSGFTVPSFPARRRLAFYWLQPIGPTHVRIF